MTGTAVSVPDRGGRNERLIISKIPPSDTVAAQTAKLFITYQKTKYCGITDMRISAENHTFENLRYHKISQIPLNCRYVDGIPAVYDFGLC